MALHDVGEPVTVRAVFRDAAAALADPTTLTFKFTNPSDGTETTYSYPTGTPSASKISTGTYEATHTVTTRGRWRWRATGTGSAAGIQQGSFRVRQVPQ